MKAGLGNIMKQAQKMQENMQKAQEELQNSEVIGESGAGMVKVVMTGKHDLKKVELDPSLLQDDKDLLEDLIAAAVNDANRKIETVTQEKMSTMTGGLNLPPGMKLPF